MNELDDGFPEDEGWIKPSISSKDEFPEDEGWVHPDEKEGFERDLVFPSVSFSRG